MGRAVAALRLPATPPAVRFLLPLVLALLCYAATAQPGFISIDCGSKDTYTDDLGITWASDATFPFGATANISAPAGTPRPLTTLRYFPADTRKYCYTLPVKNRTRYLARASFLYADVDGSNVYPKFDLSLGATHWSTIVIDDTGEAEVRELIFLASAPTVSVCVSKATTGRPFISSLELRQFNGSLYFTDYETQFYLAVAARINFGAATTDPVRYPDDPFDRIWESDSIRRANYLVGVAPGTIKVSTPTPVLVNTGTNPPSKVMQTAVVGSEGSLTYRLNLNGFPGFGWAFSYFAEIEDLAPNDTRKFRLFLQGADYLQLSKAVVDVQENAQGKYRLYEPGYPNISFPFVFPFEFRKTNDSNRGPILNAIEISKYLPINPGSPDATTMSSFVSHYSSKDWAKEGGDPCLPVPWSWVQCSTDALMPRITSINLSNNNLGGNIPSEIPMLTGLVELFLDGNSLTGDIPDLSTCPNLQKIHLENNKLSGEIPSSLAQLNNLKEL